MKDSKKITSKLSNFFGFLEKYKLTETQLELFLSERIVLINKLIFEGLIGIPDTIPIPEKLQAAEKRAGVLDAYYTHTDGKLWRSDLLLLTDFYNPKIEESVDDIIKKYSGNRWLGFSHLDFLFRFPFFISEALSMKKKIIFPAAINSETCAVFYLLEDSQGEVELLIKNVYEPLCTDELLAHYKI